MSNNKTIELPVISIRLLKQLLANPGWTKTNKDIYIAGKLDADGKLDVPSLPASANEEAQLLWAKQLIKHDYLGKEVDCVARCIDYSIKEGKVGTDKYVYALVNAFCEVE